ncbi:MDR family MFS transporter [Amnibacterium setariae]|uniref:DHA2 family efflux MFS transporter permease subunit n=1 Tax=Amnibacterium setariae TaxID=2306585 RepID=A0A3A1U1N8_9MICO|nr:MDR family MFS transporter [Amnibacterium setariae]RIX28855.1 DHA2 family efflux MFS transporter permease subunit [Amnibacterium setariae]
MSTARTAATPAERQQHREVLEALSGLLMGMFVAILAGTVVSTSLPRIIADLHGTQTAYTWVVTATLLATTVSTPIWGKLADLVNRKLLVQLALVVFVVGSALAGFSQDTNTLIAFRVVQGLGAGGLTALVQVVMADIVSPRERGRYMGLIGAVMAVGTVGGPLIGGLITDGWGWRWNFYVALPFAIAALVLIQRTLHLPKRAKRAVSIDYLGAILIAAGVSLLLIWVSLGGSQFAWASATSWLMVAGAAVLLAAAVVTELKVREPIIPMTLFRNRTFVFAVLASLAIGVVLFGVSVFLSQYLQLAEGHTPTEAGLLTLPMVVGLFGASTVVGGVISRTGVWKRYVVVGATLLVAGVTLLGTIRVDTPYWTLAIFMLVIGLGLGMTMQNLVLVTQNSLQATQLGAGSASIAFFRSLGGTLGVSALGAFLGARVPDLIRDGLATLDPAIAAAAGKALGGGEVPVVSALPAPIRGVVESAYGTGIGDVFLLAAPLTLVTLLFVCLLPNRPLSTKTAVEQLADTEGRPGLAPAAERALELGANEVGSTSEGVDDRDRTAVPDRR